MKTVAITGKGGVGKTSLAALAVRWLAGSGRSPVLAVDADPNTNLDESLGVSVEDTIGDLRESMRERAGVPAGLSQAEYVKYKLQTSLVESEDFDYLAMGRPEGPGCYCYPNGLLKRAIERLASDYQALVIDNEAGLENLSRRIMKAMDLLLVVSDASVKGIRTAARLRDLADEMEVERARTALVVNRLRGEELPTRLRHEIETAGLELAAVLPDSPELAACVEEGEPLHRLPADSPWRRGVEGALRELLGES